MEEVKQVIVLRTDLEISAGKLIVQACHASCSSLLKAEKTEIIDKWVREGSKKVILQVKSEEELKKLYFKALRLGLPCYLVQDAGLTELKPGTITALGIGPESSSLIDKVTGSIPLLKGEIAFV